MKSYNFIFGETNINDLGPSLGSQSHGDATDSVEAEIVVLKFHLKGKNFRLSAHDGADDIGN